MQAPIMPLPKAKPTPAPKPEPKVAPVPEVETALDANADPYAGLLHDEDETQKKPWYKKWWPWTIGGVVVVGAAAGIIYAATRQPAPATGFTAVGIIP